MDTSSRRRVKLYMLNLNRLWDDRGTGHVSSTYIEKLTGMSLLVRSETDGSILLESKIQSDTAYNKQQDKLIVWSEMEGCDYALSFQEKEGCDEIWENICQVQGKDPSVTITQDVLDQDGDEMDDDVGDMGDGLGGAGEAAPRITLPPCELSKLEEISELFSSVLHAPVQRVRLAVEIEQESYIKKLLDLFHMCEDLENMDGLHHLYDIFRSIFLLNHNALFEIMFADDLIFDVVGVLEYNPVLHQPAKHREYLRTQSNFKQVIPLDNPELIQKIHQTYRVQYIQDVIMPMPSVFEENMLSTLNSLIYLNKMEIVTMIQEDEKFLQTLFTQLVDDETDDAHRRDLTLFVKEFCSFSQTLQTPNRDNFFKTLANMGILSAVEIILGLDDVKMKSAAIDIFSYIVEYSPSMVREFVLQEGQSNEDVSEAVMEDDLLINLVIEQMITDSDPELGGAVQLMGIIRLLIDPDNMLGATNYMAEDGSFSGLEQKTEKTEFLGFFYKHSMHVLTAPLFANTVDDRPSKDDYQTAQLLSLILELLNFCIEHHSYHVKNYVINKDLLRRVLVLLKSKHAFVALSGLRLCRKIIGMKDEFFNRYIVKGDLLKPIVDAFVANGTKYNLLNSAMIELFEFMKEEDIKSLITYVVETHFKAFENVEYVETFKKLKQRFDQHQDVPSDRTNLDSMPSILRNNRFRRDARSMDEDEELWFDQEDDYDEQDPVMPMTDMLKAKLDNDFDQIGKFLERSRSPGSKENETRDSPPRLYTRNAINININRSPPNNNPSPTPASSPTNSPSSPSKPYSPPAAEKTSVVQAKKPGLVGLVDYPDEDSDEEELDEDSTPALKRARLST